MVSTLDRFQSIDPALLDIRAGDRVIDLGCGTGRHVLALSKQPGIIHGADISRHDLRIARYLLEIMRRRNEVKAKVHWLQMAGERLPFADAAFDRVICTETLEHVDDDAVLARELVRVLKPGGILAVSVPDEYSEKVFWKLSKNYRTHAGGHVRIYARTAHRRAAARCGAAAVRRALPPRTGDGVLAEPHRVLERLGQAGADHARLPPGARLDARAPVEDRDAVRRHRQPRAAEEHRRLQPQAAERCAVGERSRAARR